MGNEDHGERVAVTETKISTLEKRIEKLEADKTKWSLQELLILVSVMGTLAVTIMKALGYIPQGIQGP
jgi:hypothetical protein